MKINVFIDEIEFEQGIKFNFHDHVRIKKGFERELARLLLDSENENKSNFSIFNTLNNDNNKILFRFKNYGNQNFIKEIDGEQFSLPIGDTNPLQVGKILAKSIFSSLNSMDSSMMRSNHTIDASAETANI